MPRIYLAGPLTGYPYKGCAEWRNQVAEELGEFEIECLSPLRGLEHLLDSQALFVEGASEDKHPFLTDSGSVARCRSDVIASDVVLANFLGATRGSIGTGIELGWADAYRKPIFLVIEPSGNTNDHALIRGVSGFRFPDLDTALTHLKQHLLPNVGEMEEQIRHSRQQLERVKLLVADNKRKLADARAQIQQMRDFVKGVES